MATLPQQSRIPGQFNGMVDPGAQLQGAQPGGSPVSPGPSMGPVAGSPGYAGASHPMPPGTAGTQQGFNQRSGYYFDPVQRKYIHTPGSVGQDAGTAIKALKEQVPELFAPNTSTTTAFPGFPGFPGNPPGTTNPIPGPQVPDTTAANAAAFARAKDTTGQVARGAISGLRGELAGRGMLGSGLEGRETGKVINQGQQNLGNVVREQAIQQAGQNADFAKLGYQGGITQRGQDIDLLKSQQDAALRKWIFENQYRLQSSQQQSQSLAGLLGALGPALY